MRPTSRNILIIYVIIIVGLCACLLFNKHAEEEKCLPAYTKELKAQGLRKTRFNYGSLYLGSAVTKIDVEVFEINGRTSCSVAYSTNPTFVNETYINPILKLADGIELPEYAYNICVEPVKTINQITLASGEVYDVEFWSYVVDYSKVVEGAPTVILPETTVVIHEGLQERRVFHFVTNSPYSYSDLLLAGENTEILTEMQSTLYSSFEQQLEDVTLFFKHFTNLKEYTNATL